ncbi:MAG: metalloregulator ArsR/SmtB family transcription factor [Chloroflexota bacterium]
MKVNRELRILDMLKALADESRLTLLRLLHEREHSVGDLAVQVNLTEPTVSHHLARLREAGLVTLRTVGNQRFYRVNDSGLAKFKQLVAEIEQRPPLPEPITPDDQWITALGWEAWDQQVLRDHTLNGQLTHLPTKQKKLLVIARWLAMLFQPDKLYSEPEVNALLKAVYAEDYVGLRRDLVDFGYLRRERGGGKYWLAPAEADTSISSPQPTSAQG